MSINIFKGLEIGNTIKLNMVRYFVAGIVWMIIFLIWTPQGFNRVEALAYPVAFPLGFPLLMLPVSGILKMMESMSIPFIWLGNYILALMVVPADPFMFLLHRSVPSLVPVEEYGFINFHLYILVYRNSVEHVRVMDVTGSDADTTENEACPYVGNIVADATVKFLGMDWPKLKRIFTIHADWRVSTETDRDFGWIDKEGGIHKGLPLGAKIRPWEVLSSNVIAKISGSALYAGNTKIGNLI